MITADLYCTQEGCRQTPLDLFLETPHGLATLPILSDAPVGGELPRSKMPPEAKDPTITQAIRDSITRHFVHFFLYNHLNLLKEIVVKDHHPQQLALRPDISANLCILAKIMKKNCYILDFTKRHGYCIL